MKKFTTLYFRFNPNGGYDYVEVDYENKIFLQGNSASHAGHMGTTQLKVEVKNKGHLKVIVQDLKEYHGFIETVMGKPITIIK